MDLDSKKFVVSEDDLIDAGDFISDFSKSLGEHKNRLAATEAETACARNIRDRLQNETGAKVRLEAFRANPYIGRGMFPVLGIWYAFATVLYLVSFAGSRIAGILLTLLALTVFISGSSVITALFLGNRRFARFLNSRVSYNVVSEFGTDKDIRNTVVIAANHDAVLGSYFQDFVTFRKISFFFVPITAILFVLFCIIKMAVGNDTPAKISALTILPVINSIIGIFIIVTHFSPFEKHARQNNGIGTATALATYAYFVEHPKLLPDGCKIAYLSCGAENCSHGGSEAFVNAHGEMNKAKVLCIGDVLSANFQVAEYDAIRKIAFSTPVVSMVRSSAYEQGIKCETAPHKGLKHALNSLHGYTSNSFAKRNIASATVLAKDYGGNAKSEIDRNDIEKLFTLCVGAAIRLLNEKDDADSIEIRKEETENLSSFEQNKY